MPIVRSERREQQNESTEKKKRNFAHSNRVMDVLSGSSFCIHSLIKRLTSQFDVNEHFIEPVEWKKKIHNSDADACSAHGHWTKFSHEKSEQKLGGRQKGP